MVKLVKNGYLTKLSQLSHHLADNNIFHDMIFCHQKRGFRAALPFDILHTIQLGWMMYIIQGLLSTQMLSQAAKRQEKDDTIRNQGNKKQYYKATDDKQKKKTSW